MRAAFLAVVLVSACSDFDSLSRGHDAGLDLPAHCTSGTKDGDESDLDCGGSCLPYDVARACALPADCQTRTCTSNVCELTTEPPGWLSATTVPTPGGFQALGLGPDGRVYVVAGTGDTTSDNRAVAAYDADADTWEKLAPLQTSRGYPYVATGPDGRLYAIGGFDSTGSTASVEAYDPVANTWTSVASLATPRQNANVTSDDQGHIYVLGGYWGTTEQGGFGTPIYKTDMEVYDGSGAWIVKPVPITSQLQYPGVTSVGGRVYEIGGEAVDNDTAAELAVRIYEPSTDAWSMGTPMTKHRLIPGVTPGADGRIYAYGGELAAEGNDAEAFDGSRWVAVPNAPDGFGPLALAPDGRIFRLTTTASPQQLVAYGPVLQLSERTGRAGASLTVKGQNFATRATVSFSWDGSKDTVATVDTDDTGLIESADVTVPMQPGAHRLVAVDSRSRYPARAGFTVQP